MKFKYKKYGSHILRPVIPVEVIFNNLRVRYEVLVDSGADTCIFDAQIAEILGINLLNGIEEDVAGITGKKESMYIHRLKLNIGGHIIESDVGFLVNIGFFGYGVVGQKNFFDSFIVKFDKKKEEIELKER